MIRPKLGWIPITYSQDNLCRVSLCGNINCEDCALNDGNKDTVKKFEERGTADMYRDIMKANNNMWPEE